MEKVLESLEEAWIGRRVEEIPGQSLAAPTHTLNIHVVGDVRIRDNVWLEEKKNNNPDARKIKQDVTCMIFGGRGTESDKKEGEGRRDERNVHRREREERG